MHEMVETRRSERWVEQGLLDPVMFRKVGETTNPTEPFCQARRSALSKCNMCNMCNILPKLHLLHRSRDPT